MEKDLIIKKLAELEEEHNKVKVAAARVPELERQLEAANSKIASLQGELDANKKEASAKAPVLTEEQANKTAELLVERGFLDANQKEAFASQIIEDPSQLCGSIEKVASFVVASQIGEPGDDGQKVAATLDPIARFAME